MHRLYTLPLPLRALVGAGSVCRYHTLTTTILVASRAKPGIGTTRSFLSYQFPTRASASSSKLDSSPVPPPSGQPPIAESGIHKPQDHATSAEEQTLKERCLEMLVERERELEEVKAKPGLANRVTTSPPSQSSHKHPSSPLSPSTVKPFYLDPRIISLFKRLDSVHSRFGIEPQIDLKSLSIDDLNSRPHTPTKMKMQKMVMTMVKEHNTIETMLKQRENYILAKEWVGGLRLGSETGRRIDPEENSELRKSIRMTPGETMEVMKLNENGTNKNVEESATIWKKWESWDASHISHLLSEQRISNFFKGRLVEVVTKRIQNATPSRLRWEDKQAQKYKTRRELMQKKLESGERQKKAKIVDRWRSNTKTIGKESKARQ